MDANKGPHALALLLLVAGIAAIGLFIPNDARVFGWLLVMLFMLLFIVIASHLITGQWSGALIDERNKVSLSRFQLFVWMIIGLSGFLIAVLANLHNNVGDDDLCRQAAQEALEESILCDPLAVAVPEELWVLMGISVTSLVAAPLLRSSKYQGTPESTQEQRTMETLKARGEVTMILDSVGGTQGTTDSAKTEGLVVVNSLPQIARWTDIFKGEEAGNAASLDAGKIQMFFFTIILALTYSLTLADLLRDNSVIHSLPAFTEGALALLGISHAGYLTNKAIPHSQTQT